MSKKLDKESQEIEKNSFYTDKEGKLYYVEMPVTHLQITDISDRTWKTLTKDFAKKLNYVPDYDVYDISLNKEEREFVMKVLEYKNKERKESLEESCMEV